MASAEGQGSIGGIRQCSAFQKDCYVEYYWEVIWDEALQVFCCPSLLYC
jgi:hypothetical protein